jgi:Tol biopolymer transport system component
MGSCSRPWRARPAPGVAGTVIAALALAVAACSDDPVRAVEEEAPAQLFFLTHADGREESVWRTEQNDIHRINADGTGAENMTKQPGDYASLSMSPDGQKVVFQSSRSGKSEIWALSTQFAGQMTRLTDSGGNDAPRWSPNGLLVAYQHLAPDGVRIFVVNADGTNARDVTRDLNVGECIPTRVQLIGWQPNGRVMFSRNLCGTETRFYTVNADGSGLVGVSGLNLHTSYWSPDGSRIVYLDRDGAGYDLFVRNANGSGVRKLTTHAGLHYLPTRTLPHYRSDYTPWSPDGTRIVFYGDTDPSVNQAEMYGCTGTSLVYVVNVDGSGLKQLGDFCGEFNGWSPRGDQLAFSSRRGAGRDVYLVNADGSGAVNLTNSEIPESSAFWVRGR